jgi:hypothetical protein
MGVLNMAEDIKAGDPIQIATRIMLQRKVYRSMVDAIISDDKIIAFAPLSKGTVVKLPMNHPFTFTFNYKVKYEASILNLFKEDGLFLMTVQLLSTGKTTYRRKLYRHNCSLAFKFSPVNVSLAEALSYKDSREYNMRDGIIKDVSGSGINFISDEHLEKDDVLLCTIRLGGNRLNIVAKVLQRQHASKTALKYRYRASFDGREMKEQNLLIDYINKDQQRRDEWQALMNADEPAKTEETETIVVKG